MSHVAALATAELEKLPKAWTLATSEVDDWASNKPYRGQSDVTALLVQERLGGEIVRVEYATPAGETGAHYFNLLPDGKRADFARASYPEGTEFSDAPNDALLASTTQFAQEKKFSSIKDYLMAQGWSEHCEATLGGKTRSLDSGKTMQDRLDLLKFNLKQVHNNSRALV